MATTITAGNSTNGAAISSDNTGILELKTGTGSGTTAMTVNTSQNVGLGTSSLTYRLEVSAGNGQGIRFTDTANSVQNFLGAYNSVGLLGTLSNHPVAFWTNNTERARFNTTGAFVFNGGTTTADGIGITFPATQSASTNANTLDDYEEGSWTPTITYSTPGTLSVGYTSQNGTYTKIGNTVILHWGIRLNAFTKGTASGDLRIGGMPFSSDFDTPIGTLGLFQSSFTSQPISVPSSNFIQLYRMVNNSGWVSLDDPDSNAQYFGTVVMRVA